MFNWTAFTLLLFIIMRLSGFVMFSPIFGRSGIPTIFRAGFVLMLAWMVYGVYGGEEIVVPATLLELALKLVMELGLGFLFGTIVRSTRRWA